MIDGHVADLTKRRSPIPAGGTEIKLKLFFKHTAINKVENLRGLLSRYKYDLEDEDMILDLDHGSSSSSDTGDYHHNQDEVAGPVHLDE